MAVVQISRIQQRRGKKLEGSGIPQLSSGEIGWAIDTQELYIGNGAVSEGAPTVGNTKVLTESDDIFSLANQYAYKSDTIQTGVSIGTPYYRTLRQKLDDVVSVLDFGATGDGTDQTAPIQRAINELYLKSATKGLYSSRITLYIPAGEYLISGSGLFLPPYAVIRGDGKDKTYLTGTSAANIFRTVNSDSAPNQADPTNISGYSFGASNTSINQPKNIKISDMTIKHESFGAAIYLENCRESMFENIKLLGSWSSGDLINEHEPGQDGTVITPTATSFVDDSVNQTGIYIDNFVASATSDYNRFSNVDFVNLAIGCYSDFDISYNQFDQGYLDNVGYGFLWGLNSSGAVGQANGPTSNSVKNYEFNLIDKQGFYIKKGKLNLSNNNRFINVGNDGGNSANATYAVIEYTEASNTSSNDYFARTADLTVNGLYNSGAYPSEVKGCKKVAFDYPIAVAIGPLTSSTKFMQLPVEMDNQTITLDYTYSAEVSPGPVFRHGTMTVTMNKDNNELNLADEFTFTGNSSYTGNELSFTANRVGDKVEIKAVNTTLAEGSGIADLFEFTMKYNAGANLT